MRFRNILACICFLAVPFAGRGQEADACRDFRFRTETDPYMFLENPAAVSVFAGHISMVEASFRKDNGGLVSLTESPDSYRAGALTESYIGISDKISFHGRLSWTYFEGKDMGAQVLMDPAFNPVNFLESDPATIGRRNREDYSLLGAMSYKLGDRLALGAGIEYTSADQTKVKDPRFSSVWMDMDIKAGLTFRPSDESLYGAALVWRSTLEQIRGGIYGTTDKQYFILADKGGFFGTMAGLSGDFDYVPTSELRPMKNDFYGLSLQAVSGGFSNELEVLYRNGYYGKKASSSATYFEFSGIDVAYKARLLKRSGANLHRAGLELGYELLGNNENQFKYVTPQGQNTRVEYTGRNHIMDRHRFSACLDYVWYRDADGYLPSFTAGGSLSGNGYMSSTKIYPFYRNASCVTLSADAFARRNIESGKSIFSLGFSAGFRTGFGNPRNDGSYASTSATSLQSFDDYLDRQFEYDTASAVSAGLAFKYTYRIDERFAPYAQLSDDFSTLTAAPKYLGGRVRNIALITLGVSF